MIDVDTLLADRYRLETRIASGGMGDVYAAQDTRLERPVAVKVLRAATAGDLRRFDSEIRTLAQLSHPSIVRLHDAGEQDGTPFLVMELVEGRSLVEVIRERSGDVETSRRVGIDVAAALSYAHERGIVHRDVKPGNVLIDQDGRSRLADFGIARLADATGLTATGTAIGTAAYLAPEQLSGNDVGPPADVYSLGLVLLELLTGRRAFEGTGVEAAFGRLSRDPEVPGELPPAWRALLRAMTARDPGGRPMAQQVGTALRDGPTLKATESLGLPTTEPLDTDAGPTVRMEPPTEDGEPTVRMDEPAAPVAEPDEVPAGPPPGAREGPRRRRATPYVVLLVLGVVAIAAILATTLSGDVGAPEEQGTTAPADGAPADEDDVPGEDDLPPQLEEVVDRLEEAVTG